MALVPLLSCKDAPAGCKPLDINTKTGVRRYYEDLGDGRARLVSLQPVDHIIESNAKRRYDARGTLARHADKHFGVLAARIPTAIYDQWVHDDVTGKRKDEDDIEGTLKTNLNSNEFQKFRIAEYKL